MNNSELFVTRVLGVGPKITRPEKWAIIPLPRTFSPDSEVTNTLTETKRMHAKMWQKAK